MSRRSGAARKPEQIPGETMKSGRSASSASLGKSSPASLGSHIRQLRQARDWSLSTLSEHCGIAASTLSKVENDMLSLTYDRLLMVAQGFGLSLSEFLALPGDAAAAAQGVARISWARHQSGERVETAGYLSHYLCTSLRRKAMVPILTEAKARTLSEFGPMLRHEGEEFVFVVTGRVEVHTEFYAPEIIEAGEGVYLDSRQGHAYLNAGEGQALLLSVNSETPNETLIS